LQQGDPATRAQLQAQALTGWGYREPDQAARHLTEIQDPKARQEVLQSIAASWALADTQAALAWARGLSDPPAREQAIAAIQSNAPVGIGVSLRASADGLPEINHLIPGSPASGNPALKPGSQITAIGDGRGGFTNLKGMNLGEVTKLIRGKAGTVAVLQVIPEGGNPNQPWTVNVPRQQLMFKNEKTP
jgi:C-terminal processing protease CtpA/Prc